MTDLYNEAIDFDSWYYKNDPTHVFFYTKETFEWIREKYNFLNVTIAHRFIIFSNHQN